MTRVSLFEKIKSLVEIISSSYFFIFMLIVFIILSIYLFNTIKKDEIKTKKTYVYAYAVIIFAIMIFYNSQIFDLLDYLIDNIFIILCFPNLAVYIAMIIFLNIVMIKSVFSKKITNINKIINIIVYSSIHFILILILNLINKNNINVYDQTSLYSNQELLNLVSLSVIIFILWTLYNIITYFINKANYKIKEPIKKEIKEYDHNTIKIEKNFDNQIFNNTEENIKNVNLEDLKLEDYKRLKKLLIQIKKE